MKELWRNIPDTYELYQVSSNGRVRRDGRMLKLMPNHKGYPRVCLHVKGVSRTVFAHALVLRAFVGERPEGYECLHRNNNKTDNRLSNLRWGTRSENIQQTYDEGRVSVFISRPDVRERARINSAKNVSHGDQKAVVLNSTLVSIFRKERADGRSYKEISDRHDVAYSTVYGATTGRTWRRSPGAAGATYKHSL